MGKNQLKHAVYRIIKIRSQKNNLFFFSIVYYTFVIENKHWYSIFRYN